MIQPVVGQLCDDLPPARGSTPLGIIRLALRLVLEAGVSLRAVPRVFALVSGEVDAQSPLPEAATVRSWLQRVGLYALTERLEPADDWVLIIDHSIQLGDTKVAVVLGLRLSESPLPTRAVRHTDVRALAVLPVSKSTGEIVDDQLEQLVKRTGIPRAIVIDGGGDLQAGTRRFAARHSGVAVLYDVAHHGAILLKRQLESDERWSRFVSQLAVTKARTQQTRDACLLAPSLRPKARYMNLHPLLKWSRRLLRLLDDPATPTATRHRVAQRYGWLRDYRAAIAVWSRGEATIRSAVGYLRQHGCSGNCHRDLRRHLLTLPVADREASLVMAWCRFAREQSTAARPGERLPLSTEVLESVFGKWKRLAAQQSASGITSLILSIGAMVGEWTTTRLRAALEAIPCKQVHAWCDAFLAQTLQSERRALHANHVNKT